MANFVSYQNAQDLMNGLAAKFNSISGAYIIKGNSAFASLPATPTSAMNGFVYNVTDSFTIDNRFVEYESGKTKTYPANTNVVIVDLSTYAAKTPTTTNPSTEGLYELVNGKYVLTTDTEVKTGKTYYEKTENVKYDVMAGFIDVAAIEAAIKAVSDMIAAQFDPTSGAYAVGDLVVKDGKLYKFKAAHTAGTAWSSSEVDEVTVDELLDALATQIGVAKQAVLDVIAPTFAAATAYSEGDIVIHDGVLYIFKAGGHTAGDPWSASEVETIGTVADFIVAVYNVAKSNSTKIGSLSDSIADEFVAANPYTEGALVMHECKLYKFKAAGHTAGDPWNSAEVDAVRVEDLIESAEPNPLTTAEVNALLALLD